MASIDTDKIIQDLNTRFAAPLPEFYKRRIVFWYDEEREFEDKLDEIVLDNAKIVALTGTNTFVVKKLLCLEDTSSNYLVYFPLEPFPFSRTQKCSKILNEAQPFFLILSHATAEAARRASKASGETHPSAECGRTEL